MRNIIARTKARNETYFHVDSWKLVDLNTMDSRSIGGMPAAYQFALKRPHPWGVSWKRERLFQRAFSRLAPTFLLYRTQMCCKFYDKQISSLHACRRRFSHVWSEGNKEVEHKKIPARACVKVHKKFIALVLRMRGTVLIRLRWIFHGFPCSLKSFSRNLAWRRCWGSANF